jgi:hypothetical protein
VQRSLTPRPNWTIECVTFEERTLEMGRKLRVGAAMACLLLLGSVTVASATSSRDNRSSGSDDRKVVVLDLVARAVASTDIDRKPTGLSQGDQQVLAVDYFQAGTKVGEESAICMVTRVEANGASTVHCTGVESLPGGQITTEGTINYGPNEFPKADPYSLAIKGGTGKYRTAHGEIRIQELTATEWQITFRIIL